MNANNKKSPKEIYEININTVCDKDIKEIFKDIIISKAQKIYIKQSYNEGNDN